jgi:hypothetical protein
MSNSTVWLKKSICELEWNQEEGEAKTSTSFITKMISKTMQSLKNYPYKYSKGIYGRHAFPMSHTIRKLIEIITSIVAKCFFKWWNTAPQVAKHPLSDGCFKSIFMLGSNGEDQKLRLHQHVIPIQRKKKKTHEATISQMTKQKMIEVKLNYKIL